jgi:hypothetical protein
MISNIYYIGVTKPIDNFSDVNDDSPLGEHNALLDDHDDDNDSDDEEKGQEKYSVGTVTSTNGTDTIFTLEAMHAQFITMNERISELENDKQQSRNEIETLQSRMELLEKKNCDFTQLAKEAERKAETSLENSQDFQLWRMTNDPTYSATLSGSSPGALSRSVVRRVDSTIKMSEDTFTFLKIKPFLSRTWWFANSVWSLQLLLLIMVFIRQIQSWSGSTPFDVPFRVDTGTRVAQLLAILVTVATAKDVIIPIREISVLWITNRCEWRKVVQVPIEETTVRMWLLYILVPNFQQFVEGTLVVIIQFVFIIQSDNMIELFKDFAAIQIVAELDNAAFWLADHGYIGNSLKDDCSLAKRIKIIDLAPPKFLGIPLRPVLLISILIILFGFFMPIAIGQASSVYFSYKYPTCLINDKVKIKHFGDGICDGGVLNTYDCGFDGGDCVNFKIGFPNCDVLNPADIGNNICDLEYNTTECGFDDGDCCPLDEDDPLLGDGFCHSGHYSAAYCNYDNGDCDDMRIDNPQCDFSTYSMVNENGEPFVIGNGTCDIIPEYMNEKCNWVFGDCVYHKEAYRNKSREYPNCPNSFNLFKLGDGECDGGLSLSKKCGYDGLDCCFGDRTKVGDGKCDANDPVIFSRECGWDGFDCCDTTGIENIRPLGDGACHAEFNNKACGWDGNDCDEFNEKYPDCPADKPYWIKDGYCDYSLNSEDCGFDGGDCL